MFTVDGKNIPTINLVLREPWLSLVLEGNYTFLNRQPVYRKTDQDYLTHIVADIESKVIIYKLTQLM